MINDIFFGLQFSALIFFNLLCILAIIAILVALTAIKGIQNKTEETLEKVQETAEKVAETTGNVGYVFSYFAKPKKTNLFTIVSKFLNR